MSRRDRYTLLVFTLSALALFVACTIRFFLKG